MSGGLGLIWRAFCGFTVGSSGPAEKATTEKSIASGWSNRLSINSPRMSSGLKRHHAHEADDRIPKVCISSHIASKLSLP